MVTKGDTKTMSNLLKWGPGDTFGELFNFSDKGFKMDVWEDEGSINIKAELPGVNKDDISIEFNEDLLTITVNQKEEETFQDPTKRYYRREILNKSFTRQIHAPNVEEDKIEASHVNGFLNITIPKKAAESTLKVKKIEIK